MNIYHFLLFCFLSAVPVDGQTDFVEGPFTRLEGEHFSSQFSLPEPRGGRIYLCRNNCTKEDVLVETNGNRLRSDRYVVSYDSENKAVRAVIMDLRQSDAGRYRVGMSNSSSLGVFREFEIKVRALCEEVSGERRVYSATEGENITITCFLFLNQLNRKFLCREKCNKLLFDTNDLRASSEKFAIQYRNGSQFDVTFTRVTRSDSGRYRCGVGKQEATNTCQEFEITVSGAGGVSVLALCLTVVFVLVVVCVGLLLLYKQKKRIADYVSNRRSGINAGNPVYENTAGVSRHEESIYQDLDAHSRDSNVYCSVRP